jgi:hypothetical protein
MSRVQKIHKFSVRIGVTGTPPALLCDSLILAMLGQPAV